MTRIQHDTQLKMDKALEQLISSKTAKEHLHQKVRGIEGCWKGRGGRRGASVCEGVGERGGGNRRDNGAATCVQHNGSALRFQLVNAPRPCALASPCPPSLSLPHTLSLTLSLTHTHTHLRLLTRLPRPASCCRSATRCWLSLITSARPWCRSMTSGVLTWRHSHTSTSSSQAHSRR